MRTLALPEAVEQWSLTRLREKPLKIGAKVERHTCYTVFQMAEVAAPAEFLREFGRSRCRNLRSQSSCDSALREHWKDVSICTARGILSGFPPIKRWPQRP